MPRGARSAALLELGEGEEQDGFGGDERLVYVEFLEALAAVATFKSPGAWPAGLSVAPASQCAR